MLEVVFVLVIVFVAYVFCCALSNTPTAQSSSTPTMETKPAEIIVENTSPEPTEPKSPKPNEVKPEKVVKPTATKSKGQKKGLKNPTTGEIVTSYSNYTFAKRWIKEALVAEGLLEKIYKNNELTPEIDAAIKAAITQLENMDKYKA